ncbi:MAG: SIMPL domain-containing protein, partial [Chthoniobacterales bacterium]
MNKLFFAVLSFPAALLAQGGLPNQPYIYIEGKAELKKPGDLVTMHFHVVARHADQSKAQQEVQAKATRILASFDEKKIAQDDVIAQDINSEPQYQDDEQR